jgi:hypothetical protein
MPKYSKKEILNRINNIKDKTKKWEKCSNSKCKEFVKMDRKLKKKFKSILVESDLTNLNSITKKLKKIENKFTKSNKNYTKLERQCQCKTCKTDFVKLNKLLIKENNINIKDFKNLKKLKPIKQNKEQLKFINETIRLYEDVINKELKRASC